MTLDCGIHQLGTRQSHIAVPVIVVAVGLLFDVRFFESAGVGMLLVLLWGNLRTQARFYRWRAGPSDPEDWPADHGGEPEVSE